MKLEKINEIIGEGKAIIELFTLNKIKREKIFDLLERIIGKERLIDINYDFNEEKEEVVINEFGFGKINELLEQFEAIKESGLSKDLIKLKVLDFIESLDIQVLFNELESIEKKSELKKVNKEIIEKDKELQNLIKEEKISNKEKGGIFKFLK